MGTAKALTENPSVKPNDLRKRAESVTERANVMLPSPVFWFDGDHRFRPSRLPTTDAYQEELSAGWGRLRGWSGFPMRTQRTDGEPYLPGHRRPPTPKVP